jgi:hypothetical protein
MSAIPVRSIRLLPKSKKELDRLSGAKGEIFYDSTSKTIRVFDGTIIGGTLLNASVTVTDSPPANPTNGSLWFNSSNGGIYIYYTDGDSNQWVQPFVPAGAGGSGGDYTLPIASTTALGGVKIDGSTITINNGVISSASAYSLPIASTTILGGVKVDGTSVTINPQGVISAVSVAPSSNSFSTISVSGQSDVVADTATDILTIVAGSGITITTNATNDSLTIANSATATSSFSNISVAGQSTVVADNATDTLTLVAGTNVSITTNATNDSITINSGYDQSLNTADDVIFNTVTAGQLISSGTGVPTYTSSTDFVFNTGDDVGALILNGDLEVTGTASIVGLTSLDELSVAGLTTLKQTSEVLNTKTGATGQVDHDYSLGAIWYHTNIAANFGVNLTNLPTANNRTIVVTLILVQGATARMPTSLLIDNVASSIEWLGSSSAPTGNANKIDIVSFTLIRTTGWQYVLGSLTSFG